MPEAVIVATARSPIGRAYKGSLRDMRPDDLAVQMVNAVLAKTPQLDPRDIEDLVLGSAQPGGEAGYNLARVVAVLAGMDHLPGTTVNRFCEDEYRIVGGPPAPNWVHFHAETRGQGIEIRRDDNSYVRRGDPELYRYQI